MMRKNLVAALGFIGLVAAGTAGGSAPAAAGYACGPWNNWCRPVCGPWNGWCAGYFRYPGYGFKFGYGGPKYWGGYGRGYAYRHGQHGNWNGNRGDGHYDRDNWNGNRGRGGGDRYDRDD
jgi:hypothetical protein